MATRWGWFLFPSVLVLTGLLILSQLEIFRISFYEDFGLGRVGDHFSFANYIAVLRDPFYRTSIWVTLRVSALATLLGLLLAYPVAYVIARMRSPWSMVMLAGILLASFVTVPIKVLGLVIIFSKEGVLNKFLLANHVLTEPITLLGNEAGVVVGLIYYSIAFGVLILYSVIRTIPITLEEAARIHGCNNWRAFKRVTLPLSIPGLITVGMTMFNLDMGGFAAAALIGAGRVPTIPVLIYQTIFVETKYAIASTLSVILLIMVGLINVAAVAIIAIWRAWLRRAREASNDESTQTFALTARSTLLDRAGSKYEVLRSHLASVLDWVLPAGARSQGLRQLNVFLIVTTYVFLLAPLFVVAAASLNGGSSRAGSIHFPPNRISFDWYLETPMAHVRAFGSSAILALAASLVAILLALPVGLALSRGRFRGKEMIAAVLRAPLQIPFVIIGISFLYIYIMLDQRLGITLPAAIGLGIAHMFVVTPYIIGSVTSVLERFNLEIEEAALVHGANRWRTLVRITLPGIMPGIFAGTVYAFMVSFGDVPIALFLAGSSFVTLPMLIYQSMQVDFDATLLSTSTAVMFVGAGLLLAVQRLIGLDSLARAESGAT